MKPCKTSLQSPFAAHIEAFISQKRALGYRYGAEEHQLRRFDVFCVEQKITEPTLTKELTEQWIEKRAGEAAKSQHLRCSAIRQFALFLSAYGLAAYVLPVQKNTVSQSYTPYIFSSEELKAIFHAARPNVALHSITVYSRSDADDPPASVRLRSAERRGVSSQKM